MRHWYTERMDTTTHFYFKYLESQGTTLGLVIFQEYFSPELHFMRHQAFPSPNNSPSTLDAFSTSKKGSILKCNILLAKTSASQECSRGRFKWRLLIPRRKLESTVFRQAPEARSIEAKGWHPIKRTWLLWRLFQTRRVRNTCNKQLESTHSAALLLEALATPIVTAKGNWAEVRRHSLRIVWHRK